MRVRPSLLALLLGALSLFAAVPAVAQTGPATNLSAASGDGKLTLTWTNPRVLTAADSIFIRWKVQNTNTWLNGDGATGIEILGTSNRNTWEITGLTNGTTYVVEINVALSGTPTSWVSTTGTPQAPPPPTFTEYTVTLTADPDNLRPTEGSTVTLTATLDRQAPAGATLHFIKAMGSAVAGSDFTLSPTGLGSAVTDDIDIAGQTTATATLMVTNDGRAEGDETIVIEVGSSLTLTSRPSLTLTIPANTGRTDDTPTDDTPTDDTPSPPTPTPPTDGGPPPAVPSDPDPDSPPCGTDREDLVRFYEASGGVNWDENENWNSTEPLDQWHGVETNDAGEAVSLRLPDNNLSGDMPTEELLCLMELVELALWGNELSGDIPDKLELAVERAVLRDIEEMLNINPEWFEDYGDPYDFEDWHTGVTTDDDGRVTELDFTGEGITGEIPQSVFELQRLEEISTGCGVTLEGEEPEGVSVIMPDDCETEASGDGGCALGSGDSSVFALFLVTLLVFAVMGRTRARG